MAINWANSCDVGTDAEKNFCSVYKQGVEELFAQNEALHLQNETTIASLGEISAHGVTMVDYTNHIAFYLFIVVVFSAVYVIVRWIFRLISDVSLGWDR